MTQNSLVYTALLNPSLRNLQLKTEQKSTPQSDDTFLNMLKERIGASHGSTGYSDKTLKAGPVSERTSQAISARNSAAKAKALKNTTSEKQNINHSAVNGNETGAAAKTAASSGTKRAKAQSDAQSTPVRSAGEASSASEDGIEQDELKQAVTSLDSILALVQQLMALLNSKGANEDVLLNGASTEQLLASSVPVSSGISVSGLLKTLLEDNAQQLETLMAKLDGQSLPAEFKGLMENLQTLIGTLEEQAASSQSNGLMGLNLKVENAGVPVEELISQLKAQCGQVMDRLHEKAAEAKSTLPVGIPADNETAQAVSNDPSAAEQPMTDDSSEKAAAASEPQVKKADEKPQPDLQNSGSHQETAVQSGSEPVIPDIAVAGGQKTAETAAPQVKTTAPLSGKLLSDTVTNQVMMKVKLMTGENKQEMEIHLKPESLGKLSLKIIHDRGEVLAKITAENEQVKGILESNMQLLKDALEKNGLSLQSLSVSVGGGQEKNRFEQNTGESGGSARSFGKVKNAPAAETQYVRSQAVRSYYGEESSIDLTA